MAATALNVPTWAADVVGVVEVDGVRYEDVRWGPVNQGKVVLFHNRGVATVELDKLPEEHARRLGYRPPAAPPVEPEVPSGRKPDVIQPARPAPAVPGPVVPESRVPPQERAAYERMRANNMVLNGVLVDKSTLQLLTGFIRSKATVTGEEYNSTGLVLELAQRKPSDQPVPANLELRPGLWQPTGKEVFLRDFTPDLERDSLWRGYAQAAEPVLGYRTFFVAQDLTYEQWKKLRRQ